MAADVLSPVFAALADPTRRAILQKLARGEASVNELAAPFEMSLPAISKHLKVLERAGLIERSKSAQFRPCRIQAKPLRKAAAWVEQYRELWEDRLDQLEDYLRQGATAEQVFSIEETPNQIPVTDLFSLGVSMSSTSDQVLIRRVFQAPREVVFAAWTDPRVLEQWYAPQGCTIEFKHLDFRPGGTFQSCIRAPSGFQCWCKGTYQEIERPAKIAFTMSVCDEAGNDLDSAAAGHDSEWPRETLTTVTFEEIDGRTHFTLQQTVSEALAKKTGAHPSWLQMLDRLAERVEKT